MWHCQCHMACHWSSYLDWYLTDTPKIPSGQPCYCHFFTLCLKTASRLYLACPCFDQALFRRPVHVAMLSCDINVACWVLSVCRFFYLQCQGLRACYIVAPQLGFGCPIFGIQHVHLSRLVRKWSSLEWTMLEKSPGIYRILWWLTSSWLWTGLLSVGCNCPQICTPFTHLHFSFGTNHHHHYYAWYPSPKPGQLLQA